MTFKNVFEPLLNGYGLCVIKVDEQGVGRVVSA